MLQLQIAPLIYQNAPDFYVQVTITFEYRSVFVKAVYR